MSHLAQSSDLKSMSVLHFAPEPSLAAHLRHWFGSYSSADLHRRSVDHNVDITELPFADESYDCVYASHVLEHVTDDAKAIREVHRILKPGGLAVLPVPIVAERTIEYPSANPHEAWHVRAPGADYFDRFREVFGTVDEHDSAMYPAEHQLYLYEDRTRWPTDKIPNRLPMDGDRHKDIVPLCYR